MDGVKLAFGSRAMKVEAVRQCRKNRKEWCICMGNVGTEFNTAIFACP